MVAVVSGNSLGLSLGSMATLGQRGVLGQAAQGRSGDQVFVNAATGNLVVQHNDEYLASLGLDVALMRTYNSRGLADGDNGDNWRMGVYKTVTLSGAANKAGSTVTRVDGDGASAVYTLNGNKGYISTAGEGAFDTIESKGKNWVWTDGSTGATETYDSTGRLISAADPDGNVTSYIYNAAGLVTEVRDASGGSVKLDYDGNKLRQLITTYTDANGTRNHVRTHYSYDAANRLSEVVTDLTLNDGLAANDANSYWTRYEYESDSSGAPTTRISRLTQKDGTWLDFSYRQQGGNYVVASVADGEGRITRYDYDATTGTTSVIDPLGNVTKLGYDVTDSDRQLRRVQAPVVDGIVQLIEYGYNASGDVISAKDARGNTVTMTYVNGNQTEQKDAEGNTVSRIYSATNRLQVETLYTGTGKTGTALSTRYVYDSEDHLRFVVSAEGRVTEYTYATNGLRTSEIRYSATAFNVSSLVPGATLDLGALQDWRGAATTDRSAALRTDYTYDPLGQLSSATSYANLKANGVGILDGQQTVVTYVYGSSGRLLQAIDGDGKQSSFGYDGLDRLTASIDANNVTTQTVYDDAGNRTTVKLDNGNGLWTTSSYNRAGELINVTQTNAGAPTALGTSRFSYDAAGRLLMETDPTGRRTWHLYDAVGRKVADADAAGSVSEYRYNKNNQVVRTVRYARAADTSLLVNAAGSPTGIDFAQVRPQTHGDDRSTWAVYDAAGRLVQTIDGEGNVAQTTYDAASRVVQVKSFAKAVSLPSSDEPGVVTPEASPADDRVARNFYDKDGNLAGVLDGEGFLTVHSYDKAGQRVGSRAYATPTLQAKRAAGTLAELTPANSDTADVVQTRYYDRKGRLVGTVDGESYLTEQVYDLGGNLVRKIRYAAKVAAGASLADIRPAATTGEWKQEWVYAYTGLNQLGSETSPDGTVTRYVYDNVGNLVETTRGWQSADARIATRRYDVQGRLVAELSGEGSAQLALATGATAIDAIWASYAHRYEYDAAGRRISTTDPLGHKTLHYYDARGRLAADINAEGEVEARNYDPLGDLSQTRRYAKRLDSVSGLAGGDLSSVVEAIDELADGKDSLTTYFYDHNGRLERSRNALQFRRGRAPTRCHRRQSQPGARLRL
jgi:YD repeat-containing protein